jgi:hypothetical protein
MTSATPTKIIFLDIDGVLNSIPFLNTIVTFDDAASIDKKSVDILNRIIQETGASVVLSSAWRLPHVAGPDRTVKALKKNGFAGEVIGWTPDFSHLGLSFKKERAKEISSWLAEMQPADTFISWVVLDDNFMQILPSFRFIETSAITGITEEDATRAINILNGELWR